MLTSFQYLEQGSPIEIFCDDGTSLYHHYPEW